MEVGAFEHAKEIADRLVNASRFKTDALLKRADAMEAMGRSEAADADRHAALDDANRVIAIRRSPLNLRLRAQALMSLGRYDEALSDLEAAVARQPNLVRAHTLLEQARERRSP